MIHPIFYCPIYHNYFTPQYEIHEHNLRNVNDNYQLPRMCLSFGQRSLKFRAVKYWNSLPNELKSIKSLPVFKRKLKDYLLSNNL